MTPGGSGGGLIFKHGRLRLTPGRWLMLNGVEQRRSERGDSPAPFKLPGRLEPSEAAVSFFIVSWQVMRLRHHH